jgi:HPt (histidine-containing phosphotransfer) domain-containing protein
MNQSIFGNNASFDIAYLDEAYADDAETAATVFQQYLEEIPSGLAQLHESYKNADVECFRRHIHKQKPGFSYVGLTDVTKTLDDLHEKCREKNDLVTHREEIEQVLAKIDSSTVLVKEMLVRLQGM